MCCMQQSAMFATQARTMAVQQHMLPPGTALGPCVGLKPSPPTGPVTSGGVWKATDLPLSLHLNSVHYII
jgi:hypothetical protein